jgi:nitrate/nitrite transporter NarK
MLAIFGFSQFAFFPNTLTIFSQNFNIKHDGMLAGIFSSKSNVGNIIGFLLANLLVYTAGIQWEITMGICSILLLLVTLALYKFVP